jgi:hypothetical protein
MQDDAAGRTDRARRDMLALLASVTPADRAPEALSLRVTAKHAQARLLTRATFNADAADAAWARRHAAAQVAACTTMLLG